MYNLVNEIKFNQQTSLNTNILFGSSSGRDKRQGNYWDLTFSIMILSYPLNLLIKLIRKTNFPITISFLN